MSAFHLLYRPQNLGKIIGHEAAVTRLKGMVAENKYPNAIMLLGPTSAGKTTLARAFAAEVNGLENIGESRDYTEINGGEARTIDDVRAMIQQSKFRPQHKKKIICVDEVQNLITNKTAADCFSADTVVKTSGGDMTMKDIHIKITKGETIFVASYNHITSETEYKRILGSRRKTNSLPCVSIGDAKATCNHPVWDCTEDTYVPAASTKTMLVIK